jgi:hypothetical protein
MSPFFLANWQKINRAFCALCWMAAVVLAVVILNLATGASNAGSLARSAQAGPVGVPTGIIGAHRQP